MDKKEESKEEIDSFFMVVMKYVYWIFITVITFNLVLGSMLVLEESPILGLVFFILSIGFGWIGFDGPKIEEEINAKIFSLS